MILISEGVFDSAMSHSFFLKFSIIIIFITAVPKHVKVITHVLVFHCTAGLDAQDIHLALPQPGPFRGHGPGAMVDPCWEISFSFHVYGLS